MVHWAHPSPERKWQLDRFSRFCRADRLTERQKDRQTTLLSAMRRNNAMWDTAKRLSSDSNIIYVVPVSNLKTGIQGRVNIIISLNRKDI